MSATKALLLLKNRKVRKGLVGIVAGIVMFIFFVSLTGTVLSTQSSTALAQTAEEEYQFWQGTTPEARGYSCQGQKYCKRFNYGIVDWCAIFVGYCVDKSGYNLNEYGFSAHVPTWVNNLKSKGKIADAGNYTPSPGNLIFFDYSGRNHYKNVGRPGHIGIVTNVNGDEITIVAGNEYNGYTSDWASVSYVNRYTRNINDDTIACYGKVGADDIVTYSLGLSGSDKLVNITRNIITNNEIGVLYDKIKPAQFGSVFPNDNGAISVGVYGWHGNNALELLKTAYSINSNEVTNTCRAYGGSGAYILNSIKSTPSWSRYKPSVQQSRCIKAVLLTGAGKQAQDKKSLEYVNQYIKICKQNGLTKSKPIAYCSDILNQWGTSSFKAKVYSNGNNGVLYGINSSMTLKQIYNSKAGWGSSNKYINRRTWTYNFLKKSKIK